MPALVFLRRTVGRCGVCVVQTLSLIHIYLTIQCFSFHFVRLCAFAWENIFSLDVAVHHEDCRCIVVHFPDDARHIRESGKLAAVLAPVSCDDLIAAVLARTDDTGRQHEMCIRDRVY